MAEKVTTRIAVGLTLLGALFALLAWDHWSHHAWGLSLLTVVLTTWGCRELAKFLRAAGAPPNKGLLMGFSILYIGTYVLGQELKKPVLLEAETVLVVAFGFAVLFPPLLGTPSREVFVGIGGTILGFFYVCFLGSFVVRLRYLPAIGESAAYYAILVAKGSDICAYFIGRAFGKTKLIPDISPGKTTAGFVGGLLGGVAISAAFSAWTPLGAALPMKLSAPVGIIVTLVSIAGDLVESLFKRSAELKDSARLLPTFGGILDVTDSILTSAPATWCILFLMRPHDGVA